MTEIREELANQVWKLMHPNNDPYPGGIRQLLHTKQAERYRRVAAFILAHTQAAVEKERERCAKIADDMALAENTMFRIRNSPTSRHGRHIASTIATEIRSRKEQGE